ncbi:PI-PLC domain-containing protein [Streptomyces sp. NPDC057694]|uniref:PI-PLC domain-containing protein n=1 Tax=Streptomyces sp. NPDC057694 TaxID=3346216 RepID=UPI0036B47CCD
MEKAATLGTVPSRALRVAAFVGAVLATVCVILAAALRGTVLAPDFYASALDREHAYDRLYDQVLVDPRTAPATRQLLAQLPVPEAQVTSNIKLVLPPDTVRALVRQQIDATVGYLNGSRSTLDLTVDLRPVLTNLDDLAQVYLGDLVAGVQNRSEPDFQRFSADLSDALRELAAGRAPQGVPRLSLTESQTTAATTALLAAAPADQRQALRPEVETALADGDVATALAAVAASAHTDRAGAAVRQLQETLDGGTWDPATVLAASGNDLRAVHDIRPYTSVGLGLVEAVAAVVLALCLLALWFTGPPRPGRRLMGLAGPLLGGAALVAVAVGVWELLGDGRLVSPSATWPPSLNHLIDDVQDRAHGMLLRTVLLTALVAVVAAALLVVAGRLLDRRQAHAAASWRAPAIGLGAAGLAVAGIVVTPLLTAASAPRLCQGSAALCDRPYDEVAELTAHNAMATTVDRFIGPLQDPDITTQLNDGVRALQLDTYRWERPEEITARLDESDFTAEQKQLVQRAVNTVNPPRDGLWLCHAVCRAGAVALVPELREIGAWMRQHPTEVITFIVQDEISASDTEQAFHEAGLDPLLHTPDADPDRPWPTLGQMIDSGRRLVVFAEDADGPAPWYRNFYRYGMETPFAFRSPEQMNCSPHRGGTGKRLFLLNHFITDNGGSRLDAGTVNARRFVLDRVRRCERERGHPVNFVAVDYATIGDAAGAVRTLNEERSTD